VALAPDFAVKNVVQGERYDLVGRTHQLRLVEEDLAARTPRIDMDGSGQPLLVVRHGPPQRIHRDIIALYRQEGLAWVRREGRQYQVDGRIAGLRYAVRDFGRRRWGVYCGPPQYTTTLHWAVFGLPMRFIEYVLVHELAHAARPGGRAHGRAWRWRMNRWMPDWEQRQSELAEVGRHAWLGDGQPRS
jgi:predicted metal-dependent hydrolase